MRTEEEIRRQILGCRDEDGEFVNPWPNMKYAEGVEEALRWVIGDEDHEPLEDENE